MNGTLPTDPCDRAIGYSGLGVRSAGLVRDFLDRDHEIRRNILVANTVAQHWFFGVDFKGLKNLLTIFGHKDTVSSIHVFQKGKHMYSSILTNKYTDTPLYIILYTIIYIYIYMHACVSNEF